MRPTTMRSTVVTRVSGGVLGAALMIAGSMLVGGSAPGARAAAATVDLTSSGSCAALRQWYVDRAIGQVGPYGWNGTGWMERGPLALAPTPGAGASGQADSASGLAAGTTGTNLQEAGVDEPDVAKTDGRTVVRLVGEGRVLLTDVTGATPRELAGWSLPRDSYADGLLLVGTHVLVAAHAGPVPMPMGGVVGAPPRASSGTEIYDLDISDPAVPRLAAHTSWSGRSLSLRQYGDVVRLVTDTGLPALRFVQPALTRTQSAREQERSTAVATRRNRQVVEDSTIADWLPSVTHDGTTSPAVACDEVLHPRAGAGGNDTLTVLTWRPATATAGAPVAVTGAGSDVYSSADRLYVWSTGWADRVVPMEGLRPQAHADGRTTIHELALDGLSTRYLATGQVTGTVRDRWSLDEQDGYLRVALSFPSRMTGGPMPYGGRVSGAPVGGTAVGGTAGSGAVGPSGVVSSQPGPVATDVADLADNGIAVLDTVGDRLVTVGQVRGLGRGEELQAVRWLGSLAVLVTYHQTDPVWTVDLTDPASPHLLGELRLPGFSSYVHPIGGGRLLGLGVSGATTDLSRAAGVSVFDIADPRTPRVVGAVHLAAGSWLDGATDPHAFTWVPGSVAGTGIALTPLRRDGVGTPTVLALRVAEDGRVSARQLPSPGGSTVRALPLPGSRVALVGDRVDLVSTSAG